MLTPILFLGCLFFLLSYLTIATSTPLYDPVENIVVNCGSPSSLKGNDDRDWIEDKGSKFAPTEEPNHKSKTSKAQSQVDLHRDFPLHDCPFILLAICIRVSGHSWPEIRLVVLLLRCLLRF